jgi:hypothetical protein
MNNPLAEQLLSKVMDWTPAEFSDFGLDIQAMASYKYDEYQQFSPGMRFTESLASWLGQFPAERRAVALEFVRRKLIFVSTAEINHLVSIAYPDHIRPLLLDLVAKQSGISRSRVRRLASSTEFEKLQRKTLFLGLSDGARTDVFRRSNKLLSNEQVRQSHELSRERVSGLLDDLRKSTQFVGDGSAAATETFEVVVLMDDFSASGISYVRAEKDGSISGKIAKFLRGLGSSADPLSKLVIEGKYQVILMLLLASAKAEEHVRKGLEVLAKELGITVTVVIVQRLPLAACIAEGQDPALDDLLRDHYDDDNETESTRLGGTDLRYGFAGCGLPLVLSHNTPNNSIGLVWADGSKMRSLFPRVTRHKEA